MSYYPEQTYVIFYDHDTPYVSKWSCSAVYALQCNHDAFLLRERNPITMRLKDIVKEIIFTEIKKLELEFDFYIPKVGVPIKHVYEKDPSGAFFDEETMVDLNIVMKNGETIAFMIGTPKKTLATLLEIVNTYAIELEVDEVILKDMINMSSHDLYQKYVKAHIDFEPFIVKENKHGW